MARGGAKPGERRGGRKKGSPNKNTAAIKDMILQALSNVGGEKYLEKQAKANPGAFMQLLGKIMPTQLTGPNNGPLQVEQIRRTVVDPRHPDTEGLPPTPPTGPV